MGEVEGYLSEGPRFAGSVGEKVRGYSGPGGSFVGGVTASIRPIRCWVQLAKYKSKIEYRR